MGMIYKRGEVFWIKYYSGGKPIRESAGTAKQKEAERFLKDRGRCAKPRRGSHRCVSFSQADGPTRLATMF